MFYDEIEFEMPWPKKDNMLWRSSRIFSGKSSFDLFVGVLFFAIVTIPAGFLAEDATWMQSSILVKMWACILI